MHRRIGRLSMLIDLMVAELPERSATLVTAAKREMELLKEVSTRMVELPRPPRETEDAFKRVRPAVTSRRP